MKLLELSILFLFNVRTLMRQLITFNSKAINAVIVNRCVSCHSEYTCIHLPWLCILDQSLIQSMRQSGPFAD